MELETVSLHRLSLYRSHQPWLLPVGSENPGSDHDGDGGEGEDHVGGEAAGVVAAVLVAVLPALHQNATSEVLVLAAAGIVRLELS